MKLIMAGVATFLALLAVFSLPVALGFITGLLLMVVFGWFGVHLSLTLWFAIGLLVVALLVY